MGWTNHQTGWLYHRIVNEMDGDRKFFTYTNDTSVPQVIEYIRLRLGAGQGEFFSGDYVNADGSSYTVYAHGTGSDGVKRTSQTHTISNIVTPTSGGYPSTPLPNDPARRTFKFDAPIYVAPGKSVVIYLNITNSKTNSTMIYDKTYRGSSVVDGNVVKIWDDDKKKWVNAIPYVWDDDEDAWKVATAYVWDDNKKKWDLASP